MTSMLVILLIAGWIYGAVVWRLRGGAFTAAALTLPLAAFNAWLLILLPAFWAGWSIAGWGAFQTYGNATVDSKNSLDQALARSGLSPLWRDVAGMAIEGLWCMAPVALAIAAVDGWRMGLLIDCIGAGFALQYAIAELTPLHWDLAPLAKAGNEWGEIYTGGWIYAWLICAALVAPREGLSDVWIALARGARVLSPIF